MSDTSFGNWLKARRRSFGMTQGELAQQVYCAEITIRKIEADELRPSKELAELIVNALQVQAEEHTLLVQLARRRRGLFASWQ